MSTKTDRCVVCNANEYVIFLSYRDWCRRCETEFARVREYLRALKELPGRRP